MLFIEPYGLLIAVASLVAEHGLQVSGLQCLSHVAQQLWRVGSRALGLQ